MLTIRTDYEKIFSNIIKTATKYLNDNRSLKTLVVGLSGGIDSGLVCALAYEVLRKVPGVRLIGRSLPIETNTDDEMERAEKIGINFCDLFETKDLTDAYIGLYKELVSGSGRESRETVEEKIRRGNVKARVRMSYLFDLAHLEKGMVLSTDNYTELLLGFWTLHGDVGNYGFIQFLWKTEVYGLARYLSEKYRSKGAGDKAKALQLCIDAMPTDGLGITNSDFDQIGVSDYETADLLLIEYLKGDQRKSDHPLIQRHKKSAYKRLDPQNIPRDIITR
jgi:NAD+ synthase